MSPRPTPKFFSWTYFFAQHTNHIKYWNKTPEKIKRAYSKYFQNANEEELKAILRIGKSVYLRLPNKDPKQNDYIELELLGGALVEKTTMPTQRTQRTHYSQTH